MPRAELESGRSAGTDGRCARRKVGVLGMTGGEHVSPGTAGCQADWWQRDIPRVLGNPVPSPRQEAAEREELSAAVSKHKHLGAVSSCPQSLRAGRVNQGEKNTGMG